MKPLNILSLFDGYSAGYEALERAGIPVQNYYASEIDKNAIKIAMKNHSDIVQLGDVTGWQKWSLNWATIDLIIGGSPCQGFSFAGKRLNFNDERSKLFFEFVNILNHAEKFNPGIKFLLENVKMKKEWENIISSYLGVEPVEINSALVSAQNRKRLYWTNIGQIGQALCGTDNIYDGKPLFDTKHANIGTAGTLSTTTLSEMRKLMRTQKNIRGKETLNITPEFLIVPAALEMTAAQLLKSVSDPSQNNPNVVNIYQNAMKLIVDAELDGYSETAFYAAANPADIDTIEVTYLNGDKQPKLESQVGFDFLGIKWGIYDDFGVTVGDYRGLAKNAGA